MFIFMTISIQKKMFGRHLIGYKTMWKLSCYWFSEDWKSIIKVITLYSKIQNIVHLKQIPTASYCILLILCDTEFFHKWLGSPDMDSVRGRGSVFAAA